MERKARRKHCRDGPHGEIPTINGGFDLGMGQNQ